MQANSSWTRFAEIADALERLDATTWAPNFLAIAFPEDEGGGGFTLTYGDLALLFRRAADQIEAGGYIHTEHLGKNT